MNTRLQKICFAAVCSFLCATLLVGCQQKAKPAVAPTYAPFGTADNEILSYDPIDPQKTHLIVSITGNLGIPINEICNVFEEENPGIQVILLDITGGNSYYPPFLDWIEKGPCPDIMFLADTIYKQIDLEETFVNLSTNPLLEAFHTDALKRMEVNGSIYVLPGPSNIICMMYNKTLFAEYGWETPESFDEFVTLCKRITKDTGGAVAPWNPNAKYSEELITAIQGFAYGEVFAGVENRTLYNDFLSGGSGYSEHLRPIYEMMQELWDEGILLPEHFTYSATSRWQEFLSGKIAMINLSARQADNENYTFGFMPFPGKNPGDGYLIDIASCSVGITKKERSEREQAAVEAFLRFYASQDTQRVFTDNTFMVSNVKSVPAAEKSMLAELQPVIDQGRLFNKITFEREGKIRTIDIYDAARRMTEGTFNLKETLAAIEASTPQGVAYAQMNNSPVAGTAAEDFTILEFSSFLADMFRDKAGADIGLIVNNDVYRGNVMRVYKGPIRENTVTVYKPRSFANGATLVKATMTGKQLLCALSDPVGQEGSIYAVSGLKCTYAPWKRPGEKALAVALADGRELDETKEYTVAFWEGTVKEAYVTGDVTRIEGTFERLFEETLRAKNTIAPAKDGRYTLQWNQ